MDAKNNTFEREFDELARWPYSLHAINDTLDSKLIEGRGKQLLFQGLNSRNIVAFVGSGVSQAYGHIGWADWLELQLGTVQQGAQAFIESAQAFKSVLQEVGAEEKTLGRFVAIKCNQIDYPKERAERLLQTLSELRQSKSTVGGELTPITFQVAQQLRELLDKAWPVIWDGKPNPESPFPREVVLRLDKVWGKGNTPRWRNGELYRHLTSALMKLRDWIDSHTTRHAFSTFAKVLLVDECTQASSILTRSFMYGGEYGRPKSSDPVREVAEIHARAFTKISFGSEALRRDIPGIRRTPQRYSALGYFKSEFIQDMCLFLLSEGKRSKHPDRRDQRLLKHWAAAIRIIEAGSRENRSRTYGARRHIRMFVAPTHRFVLEVMAALIEKPLEVEWKTNALDQENRKLFTPVPVSETDLLSRLSITDEELDPLQKLAGRLGIRQFLTTNYDFEIERYFQDVGYLRFSNQVPEARLMNGAPSAEDHRVDGLGGTVQDFSFTRERAADLISFSVDQDNADASIYHLHGSADAESRPVITERDYMDLYLKRDANRTIVDDGIRLAFSSNPILFVGLGMEEADILRPLRQFMSDRVRATNQTAIALMPALQDRTGRVTAAASLFLRYGLHSIFYGDGYILIDGEWRAVDWLYRVNALIKELININETMLQALQGLVKRSEADSAYMASREGQAASREILTLLREKATARFERLEKKVGTVGSEPGAPSALSMLYGQLKISAQEVKAKKRFARCLFRSIRKSREANTEEPLNDQSLLLLEKSNGIDPYLNFEYQFLAEMIRMTVHNVPAALDARIERGSESLDVGHYCEAIRDLRARLAALNGVKNSVQTGVFCAALDQIEDEWLKWWEFWKVSPPHRRAYFSVEGGGTKDADKTLIPLRYARHQIDNSMTRLLDADAAPPRAHLITGSDTEAEATGVRSFDNFLEALQSQTLRDEKTQSFSMGRRMHLVVAERGVGKGTFMSAFFTKKGLGQYIACSWPTSDFCPVENRPAPKGASWVKSAPPEYLSAIFVNYSFSTEIASTFDMIVDALAKACAALAVVGPSPQLSLRVKLEQAQELLQKLQFLPPKPIMAKCATEESLVKDFKRILEEDKEAIQELSRTSQIAQLIKRFSDRSAAFSPSGDGSVRFLLLLNPTDLLHHEGGLPKNREILEFIKLLTGRELAACRFDLVLVTGSGNIGAPFVTRSLLAERYREVTGQWPKNADPTFGEQERKSGGGTPSGELTFVTIVRQGIDLAGRQNIFRREARSKINRPGPPSGAVIESLRSHPEYKSTQELCTIHFARTVRAEGLLVDSFPLLATLLFTGHLINKCPELLDKVDSPSEKLLDAVIETLGARWESVWSGREGGVVDYGQLDAMERYASLRVLNYVFQELNRQPNESVRVRERMVHQSFQQFGEAMPHIVSLQADDKAVAFWQKHAQGLLKKRYSADLDESSRIEWETIRNSLGANRFCLTILMAAAERLALTGRTLADAAKRAEKFVRKTTDLVSAVGVYQREEVVVGEVFEAYQVLHEVGKPRLDVNLHRLLIRHLAVVGAPVSADVLVRMPEILRYFDEHAIDATRGRTWLLTEALTELTRRGLVFRLTPQSSLSSYWRAAGAKSREAEWKEFGDRIPAGEYRYALHRLIQRHVIRKLGAGPREFVVTNSFAPSLYASMPGDLPRLTSDAYRFLRVLVASLSQYPDNPDGDASIENWHIGAAPSTTRVQALRAALSVARSTFSIAVVSRFEGQGDAGDIANQRGHFESYRLQLRWIIRKGWHLSPPEAATDLRSYQPHADARTLSALYRDEIVWLYNECGVTCLVQGNLNDAVALLRQALEINQHIEGPMEGGMQHNRISLNLAIAQIERGRLEPARRRLQSISESERGATDPESRLWHLAHGYLGLIHHINGNPEAARQSYRRVIAMLRAYDDSRACSVFCRHLGDLERSIGNFDDAKTHLSNAIDFAQNSGQEDMHRKALLSMIRLEIAQSISRADFLSSGFNVRLNSIAEYAKSMEMPGLAAEVLCVRANLLVADGETRFAGPLFAEAMALAKRNGMRLRLNSALTGYARVLGMTEQKEQARRLLLTSLDLAKRQKNQIELRRVEKALAGLWSERNTPADVADIFR